jgi:hypothetical protein
MHVAIREISTSEHPAVSASALITTGHAELAHAEEGRELARSIEQEVVIAEGLGFVHSCLVPKVEAVEGWT